MYLSTRRKIAVGVLSGVTLGVGVMLLGDLLDDEAKVKERSLAPVESTTTFPVPTSEVTLPQGLVSNELSNTAENLKMGMKDYCQPLGRDVALTIEIVEEEYQITVRCVKKS